jgi:Trk K+ transport system NAD-binding subunit
MHTIRQNSRDDSHKAARNILVIGGDDVGLAVAEYLSEGNQSVTFVSEPKPSAVADEVNSIHRKLSGAQDVRALASETTDIDLVVVIGSDSETLLLGYLIRCELDPREVLAGISNPANEPAFEGTGVDHIDIPQLLSEYICDRYG